ncbi:MAG: exonuclease SbcCD subunit D [Acidaminococcaceae bacterium]|nr:exonuclease SbcCD subunit D [Acidaminococcaceae bacterium]
MLILHTADWHLGRIFHGLHMTDEQKTVLAQLLKIAVTRKVDAVLIAGDIYDRAVPPTEAVNLLNNTLKELVIDYNIPVILIAGNHDNPDRLNFGQALFAENKLFIYGTVNAASKPVVLNDAYGPVYFAPLPYCEPAVAAELSGTPIKTHEEALQWQLNNMLSQIPENSRKIAVAHVFLTGATESPDSERPLSIGGSSNVSAANFAPFNYTALGHLHYCQQNGEKIRYSGSLLKYSFNEVNQPKGLHLINLDAKGNITVETLELQPKHQLAQLTGTFQDLLNNPRQTLVDHYLQITLTDITPVIDAKNRLEAIYPHILHLEYTKDILADNEDFKSGRHQELSIKELFFNFFEHLHHRPLNALEETLLNKTIETAQDKERRS